MLRILNQLTRNPRYEWDLFDRVFNQFANEVTTPTGFSANAPVNIYTNDEVVKIVASIPGWQAEWFNLSVEGNRLLLEGKTVVEEDSGESEISLRRNINLPFRVEPEEIQATYKDGILTIDLKKSEQDRPRKIKIEAA